MEEVINPAQIIDAAERELKRRGLFRKDLERLAGIPLGSLSDLFRPRRTSEREERRVQDGSAYYQHYYKIQKWVRDSTMSTHCSSSGSSWADGDSTVKLVIRIRPPVSYGEGAASDHATCLDADVARHSVIMKASPEPKVFTFDEVSDHNTTQEEVFSSVCKKIIDGCINGYNGTIFAYGQTGSGKTFTMMGPHEDSDWFQNGLRGIIPRSFEYLFEIIKKEREINGENVKFLCKCSFLEIYNEQIYDLLKPAGIPLSLHDSIKLGVYVEGLQELVVASPVEAYNVLTSGRTNRTVAETSMNRESSRSHAVFTFIIESKVKKGDVWNIKMSRLHLVDLAGSERQKDTNTTGQRLKEAGNINKSLSVLGNVITALIDVAQGKPRHVPYRNSKLSFLLRDSLGGNSKTCIVACVNPGSKCFGETLSTLLFARRAKMIKNKAVVNEDFQGSVTTLQAEIKKLKDVIKRLEGEIKEIRRGIVFPSSADSDDCFEDDSGKANNGLRHLLKDNNIETTAASTAVTIAMQQAKMSSLHEAMEALKRECSETVERMAREQINDRAEIVSLQKESIELQRSLQAHKIRKQLERDTCEDLQSRIKAIVTPRKSGPQHQCYSKGAGSGVSPLNLDASGASDENIGQGSPAQINEEHVDGLTQEISHLQEELKKANKLLEKADNSTLMSAKENARLNEQNKQLNELFEEAKCKWETTRVELERANRMLTDENSTLVNNNKLTLSELHDQRLVGISTDQRLKELAAESKRSKAACNKELQQLKDRLMKLSLEHSTLETDLEMTTEERDQLREREYTLQVTLDFNADQLSAVEQRLEFVEATNNSLDDMIVTLTTHLEEFKREKKRSLNELHEESGAIESQLFEALTLVDIQRADLYTKTSDLKTKDKIITSLELKLSETELEVKRLTKSEAKREEVLASLTSRVTVLEEELSHMLKERDNATTELKELHEKIAVVQSQCCKQEAQITAEITLHQEIVSKLQQTINSRDLKYGVLREDFEHLQDQQKAELQRATSNAEKNKDLEQDVTRLKTDNAVLLSSVIEWQTRCEVQEQQLDLLKSELVSYKLDLEAAHTKLEQERTINANSQAVINMLDQDQKQQHDELLKREKERSSSISKDEYLMERLSEENFALKERIKKMKEDYVAELSENAKLSGQSQKFKMELVKQQQELDGKNAQLTTAMAQLAAIRGGRLPSATF